MFKVVVLNVSSRECNEELVTGRSMRVSLFSECAATSRLPVQRSIRGMLTRSYRIVSGGVNCVGEVCRTVSCVDGMHHGAQFEFHTQVDRRPMELPQYKCQVITHLEVEDKSGCGILNTL